MRNCVYEKRASLVTKFAGGAIIGGAKLGERQIRVIVSTPTPDRVGDVLDPGGCNLKAYRRNPVVLRDHDRTRPVGTAQVEIKSDRVEALITFADPGVSECADETCALMKSGILNAVSAGFIIHDASPIKGGGLRIKKWELIEISCVSCPANSDAIVTERSLDPDAEHRRREIEILQLKGSQTHIQSAPRPAPTFKSAAERAVEIVELRAKGDAHISELSGVQFTAAKSSQIQREALKRSALFYFGSDAWAS